MTKETDNVLITLMLTKHQEDRFKELLKKAYDRGYKAGQGNPKCGRCGGGFSPDYLQSVCGTCDGQTEKS